LRDLNKALTEVDEEQERRRQRLNRRRDRWFGKGANKKINTSNDDRKADDNDVAGNYQKLAVDASRRVEDGLLASLFVDDVSYSFLTVSETQTVDCDECSSMMRFTSW
jgi:hypothetical protein